MMKFNLYTLTDNFAITDVAKENLKESIKERLETIEEQILLEYLKKQKGKLGIKNLGNEMRYNSILKNEFNTLINNEIIVKMTENRRSFIKVFLDNWASNNKCDIYYFILESSFGNSSKIVDSSFIRIDEIKEELSKFHDYFNKTTEGPRIHFIEMKGFNSYYLIDNNGYSTLNFNNK